MANINEEEEKDENGYELISKTQWKKEKQLNDLRMLVKKSNDRLPLFNEIKGSEQQIVQTKEKTAKKDSTTSITPEMVQKVESFFENFEIVKFKSLGTMSRQYFVKPKGRKSNQVYILKCISQRKFSKSRKKWKALAEKYVQLEKGTDNIDWYQYFQDNVYFYVLKEYFDGLPLYEAILYNDYMTWKSFGTLVTEMVFAAKRMHMKDLSHTDIKPKNVLMQKYKISGEELQLKGSSKELLMATLAQPVIKIVNPLNLVGFKIGPKHKRRYIVANYISPEQAA